MTTWCRDTVTDLCKQYLPFTKIVDPSNRVSTICRISCVLSGGLGSLLSRSGFTVTITPTPQD